MNGVTVKSYGEIKLVRSFVEIIDSLQCAVIIQLNFRLIPDLRNPAAYDAGGRVTRTVNGRGQVLDLAWNLQGELVSVSTNGVFAEGYAYDPMGRRISTTDANGTVYHAYDGIHCIADLAPDGTLLRSYTWGSGVDIKRAQSPRRSRRATAILSPPHRDGARSGIPRRSGNCTSPHTSARLVLSSRSTSTTRSAIR